MRRRIAAFVAALALAASALTGCAPVGEAESYYVTATPGSCYRIGITPGVSKTTVRCNYMKWTVKWWLAPDTYSERIG